MTSPNKLNEFNHAEDPARRRLEKLGWAYVPREALADERGDERDVLLKSRLTQALLRLNEWLTEEQAHRVIFDLEHIDATGMARNQAVHEYLTCGMPLDVETPGDGGRVPPASLTSTTLRADSTSSWSPPSSGSGEAPFDKLRTNGKTTSAWSSPTWSSSLTAFPW